MVDIKVNGQTYSGLESIEVAKADGSGNLSLLAPSGNKALTPSLTEQTGIDVSAYATASVAAITRDLLASLDPDFVAGNIKKDVDLFGLVGSLGGGGLPDWISECQVVEYVPTEDSNETKTFAISMSSAPDIIIVASDIVTKTANKQFVGLIEFKCPFDIQVTDNGAEMGWRGYAFYTTTTNYIINNPVSQSTTNAPGVQEVTSSAVTMNTYYYAGAMVNWTAGATYKIICLKGKAVSEW